LRHDFTASGSYFHVNARDSRTISSDHFEWLSQLPDALLLASLIKGYERRFIPHEGQGGSLATQQRRPAVAITTPSLRPEILYRVFVRCNRGIQTRGSCGTRGSGVVPIREFSNQAFDHIRYSAVTCSHLTGGQARFTRVRDFWFAFLFLKTARRQHAKRSTNR